MAGIYQRLIAVEVIQTHCLLSAWLVMDDGASCNMLDTAEGFQVLGVTMWAALLGGDKWLLICIGDFP